MRRAAGGRLPPRPIPSRKRHELDQPPRQPRRAPWPAALPMAAPAGVPVGGARQSGWPAASKTISEPGCFIGWEQRLYSAPGSSLGGGTCYAGARSGFGYLDFNINAPRQNESAKKPRPAAGHRSSHACQIGAARRYHGAGSPNAAAAPGGGRGVPRGGPGLEPDFKPTTRKQ
jgi:hypothetical protein